MGHMRERKLKLEGELKPLAATAAETGPSAFLVAAIHEREQQLREISDQLLAGGSTLSMRTCRRFAASLRSGWEIFRN
jgi:hypothetical protein